MNLNHRNKRLLISDLRITSYCGCFIGILIIPRSTQFRVRCRIVESRDRWHQMTSDDILSFCILLHSFHFACWMAGPSKLTGQKLFCPWLSSPHILSPCSSSEHLQPLALHGWHLFPFRDAVRALILLSARKRRQSRWPPPWPWRWPPPWPWRRPWPALQLWWHDPGWLLETEHQSGHFWDYAFVINTSSCRVNAVTLQKYSKGKLDRVILGWFFRFFKRQYTIISSNPHAITSATGGEKLRKRQCWHSTTKPAYSPARMYHESAAGFKVKKKLADPALFCQRGFSEGLRWRHLHRSLVASSSCIRSLDELAREAVFRCCVRLNLRKTWRSVMDGYGDLWLMMPARK